MNNLNLVLYIVLHYITMFPVPQNDAITNNNFVRTDEQELIYGAFQINISSCLIKTIIYYLIFLYVELEII